MDLDGVNVQVCDAKDPEVQKILQTHYEFCVASTPREHVHALDLSKFSSPDITVFGAKLNGELVGVGALRTLEDSHAELKSMHTLAKVRGKGVAKYLVTFISQHALDRGITQLSLETGTNDEFKPARSLYEQLGFEYCDAFGEYENTEDNICMTKNLLKSTPIKE